MPGRPGAAGDDERCGSKACCEGIGLLYLEDHPMTRKCLGSPPFITAMKFGHLEGVP